jgi:hypothetical protein
VDIAAYVLWAGVGVTLIGRRRRVCTSFGQRLVAIDPGKCRILLSEYRCSCEVPKADAKGCPKGSMAPHNHAVEKGMGSSGTAPCGPKAKVAKYKNAHNHGQFHKNQ